MEEYANELGIELLFLPSYSPNLNLIERLWREVLHELETLLTCRFEIFKEVKLLN